MTPLSPRYAGQVIALGLAAALVVGIHFGERMERDDCRDPGAVGELDAIPGTISRPETPPSRQGLALWEEGRVNTPGLDAELEFRIVRSFEPAPLITKPLNLLTRNFEVEQRDRIEEERGGERIPVHWFRERMHEKPRFVALYYVSDGRPVASPFWSSLAASPARLIRGRQPLTLVMVGGAAADRHLGAAETIARRWLFDVWDHTKAVCRP